MESNIEENDNSQSPVIKEKEESNKFYIRSSLDNLKSNYLKIMKQNQYYLLHLSTRASNFKQFNLLKFHIIFYNILPKIFIIPMLRTFAFGLHINCKICKQWLEEYLEDGKDKGKNKKIIIENNYLGKNGIIIIQFPQIQNLFYFCPSYNESYKPWLLNTYNIEIFPNIKGNIHTCVTLKKTAEGKKEKAFLDLQKQIIDTLISINSIDIDLLDRLGLLMSFTDRLIDYKYIISQNAYNKLMTLYHKYTLHKIHMTVLFQDLITNIKLKAKYSNAIDESSSGDDDYWKWGEY